MTITKARLNKLQKEVDDCFKKKHIIYTIKDFVLWASGEKGGDAFAGASTGT